MDRSERQKPQEREWMADDVIQLGLNSSQDVTQNSQQVSPPKDCEACRHSKLYEAKHNKTSNLKAVFCDLWDDISCLGADN